MDSGGTVFLVGSPELDMAIAFPRVVSLMPIRDLCKEGTWVFR
jgi:hypothetical protein